MQNTVVFGMLFVKVHAGRDDGDVLVKVNFRVVTEKFKSTVRGPVVDED